MKTTIIIAFLLVTTAGIAQSDLDLQKKWGLGINGGYCNDQTFTPDIYVQYIDIIKGYSVVTKMGVNYHRFNSEFQSFNTLETKSVGLFAEVVIFPFHNSFFTGIRWDFLTFNKLTNIALDKLETFYSRSAFSGIFSGTNLYVIGGFQVPIAKNIDIQLYAMPGIREYKIYQQSEKALQSSNINFIYQINIGINFSF